LGLEVLGGFGLEFLIFGWLGLSQLSEGTYAEGIRHPAEGRMIVCWGLYWVSIARLSEVEHGLKFLSSDRDN